MQTAKSGDINAKQQATSLTSKTLEMSSQSRSAFEEMHERTDLCEHSVFVKEMLVMCDQILDKSADEGSIVDFHELMFKFTLDSFV